MYSTTMLGSASLLVMFRNHVRAYAPILVWKLETCSFEKWRLLFEKGWSSMITKIFFFHTPGMFWADILHDSTICCKRTGDVYKLISPCVCSGKFSMIIWLLLFKKLENFFLVWKWRHIVNEIYQVQPYFQNCLRKADLLLLRYKKFHWLALDIFSWTVIFACFFALGTIGSPVCFYHSFFITAGLFLNPFSIILTNILFFYLISMFYVFIFQTLSERVLWISTAAYS